jgi:hypothetical protein
MLQTARLATSASAAFVTSIDLTFDFHPSIEDRRKAARDTRCMSMSTQTSLPRVRDNVRGSRYGEFFAVKRHGFELEGTVWNTFGLSDCSPEQWAALDTEAMKKQMGVDAVILNGPRFWMMDSVEASDVGQEIKAFGELQVRKIATIRFPITRITQGRQPYRETSIGRTTAYTYLRGRPIFELVARGKTYVMQSYSHTVDSGLGEADLVDLASRLQLPGGWQYGSRVLDQDLILRAHGSATILQDDLQNTYHEVVAE